MLAGPHSEYHCCRKKNQISNKSIYIQRWAKYMKTCIFDTKYNFEIYKRDEFSQ